MGSPTTSNKRTLPVVKSTAILTKKVTNRPRYAQLSTEKIKEGTDDVFVNLTQQPGPMKFAKWRWNSTAPSFPTPQQAEQLAPSTKIDLERLGNYFGAATKAKDETTSPLQQQQTGNTSMVQENDTKNEPAESKPASPATMLTAEGFSPALDTNSKKASSPFTSNNDHDKLLVTWMGHASFFVQVDGANILTDPVFSERCSPVQFAGPKRYQPVPCKIEELPRVDIVTISHNHYDHLDNDSVDRLRKTFNPIFVVPRGMKTRYFANLGWPATEVESRVVELGWYQSTEIQIASRKESSTSASASTGVSREASLDASTSPNKKDDLLKTSSSAFSEFTSVVQITFAPVQHWTMRGAFDRNKELWGGFVVEHFRSLNPLLHQNVFHGLKDRSDCSFVSRWFHSGDTGYNATFFKEIGQEFADDETNIEKNTTSSTTSTTANANDDDESSSSSATQQNQQQGSGTTFDLALIPIGAYEPRFIMESQHVNPEEAVLIHKEIRSNFSLGMHWGTFILTDEPIDEPPKKLAEACKKHGVAEGAFIACKHGETFDIPLRGF